MSRELFHITESNPNDVTGGGGCACSETKVPDCQGPFVVFPAVETEAIASPYVVVGCGCLESAARGLLGEVLSSSNAEDVIDLPEDDVVDVTVVGLVDFPKEDIVDEPDYSADQDVPDV